MRLKLSQAAKQPHTDGVTAVTYTLSNTLLSCSDDGTIAGWGGDNECTGVLAQTPDFGVTDVHFCPTSADVFAVGGSDGTLRLFHRSGKVRLLCGGPVATIPLKQPVTPLVSMRTRPPS